MLNIVARSLPALRSFSSSRINLSGHNKWSKIKQKKGANDAQKGSIFGKASRNIVLAVRNGGSADPNKNLQLAAVLRWAKEQDIPKENIEKALIKATQGKDRAGDSFTYEALAFGSIGIIIECSTDNTNRTIHSIRGILNKHSARAAPVMFMFRRQGYVRVALERGKEGLDERMEQLIETALVEGAEDFESETLSDTIVVKFTCQPSVLANLTAIVGKPKVSWDLLASELIYAPLEIIESSEELGSSLKDLVDDLESNEDVLRVWTSLDPS